MPSQFVHIECYSLTPPKKTRQNAAPKWSAGDILAEAARRPGACDHVTAPLPPTLIHGATLEQVEAELTDIQSNARDAVGRRLRKDATVLLAGVASYPSGGADYEEWKRLTVEWLHGKFGENLRAVVEHLDESHPHLHFFAVDAVAGNVKGLHPGFVAAKGAPNPALQRKAYTVAMQAFQDEYWEHVGGPTALARIGPRRRRLTRDEWAREQADLRAQAATMQAARAKLEDVQMREKRLSELAQRTLAQAERFMQRLDALDAPQEGHEPPAH
ncbi:plasmid recombination protein [Laribacter hongkongensis]|uniref:plasmid recombination protein n=1 Tax=Laribacter hongkongensis TaxID=168471 RepID=UPI001EFE9776|nr:plasmid recombination protein [Laribacter hongkongensis]MCG9096680.1 plasmid recombination protein [Laribacter hongkongensis]